MKVKQLEEKEKMITLLKAKNEKWKMFNDEVNERLTTTAFSLNKTVQR